MEAKYVDQVAIFGIACLAVGIAWFWVARLPECRAPYGSMTDWIQAAGAVVTALVATAAFATWRKPDDARRRGDTAQTLLRLSRNAENALFSMRMRRTSYIRTPQPTDADIARMMKPVSKDIQQDELKAARVAINELDTYRAEATHMFGVAVQQKIEAIIDAFNELGSAAELLLSIGDSPELVTATGPEGGVPGIGKMVRKNLEILGVAWVSRGNERTDEFADGLRQAGNELRELLVRHLPR